MIRNYVLYRGIQTRSIRRIPKTEYEKSNKKNNVFFIRKFLNLKRKNSGHEKRIQQKVPDYQVDVLFVIRFYAGCNIGQIYHVLLGTYIALMPSVATAEVVNF